MKTGIELIAEEKQLLLIELCARLPYGVICHYNCVIPIERRELHKANCIDVLKGIVPTPDGHIGFMVGIDRVDALEGDIKPYLRSLSNMTDEEKTLMATICLKYVSNVEGAVSELSDFYNSRHFDYRGLIPMGVALEAPKDMYKTE
jgi:hypothetical protein